MDRSFREQGSNTREAPKSFLASLRIIARQLLRLAAKLIRFTEEEAGIYLDRPGGE